MVESALSMLGDAFSIPAFIRTIKDVTQDQPNSSIHIQANSGESWWLDFYDGQLLWASGGNHRFRRWQRLLRQTCTTIQPSQVKLREPGIFNHWEYLALSFLLQRQQIDQGMAANIIQQTLLEVLFDIFHNIDRLSQITIASNDRSPLIKSASSSSLFYQAGADLQAWQTTHLGNQSPNLSPVIVDTHRLQKSTQPRTYQVLRQFLRGRQSLRELSLIMGHDLTALGRMLEGFIKSGIVTLNSTVDLSTPYAASESEASPQVTKNSPLIFCIDDSSQVNYLIEETLHTAGYHCISLQDSVPALVQIIRHKPQMIFLGATMPIANGYEICKQIRRAKAFCHTPIIILLDNDSFMARAQAKSAGATAVIVKPIVPSKLIDIVKQELAVA